MGGSMSSGVSSPMRGGTGLGDIPEGCIAEMLDYLNPTEICELARTNRAFRGASSADFIWESKLPSTYPFIARNVLNLKNNDGDDDDDDGGLLMGVCRKELFARLSRPNLFDGGNKEIWLDKKSGGVCVSISSKALSITGIDDRRYWNHISNDESRFQTIAYLQQIWWFEVCGGLDFKFPAGTYNLFFRLQLGRTSKRFGRKTCNMDQIQGWDIRPIRFKLSTSDGQDSTSQYFLKNTGSWDLYHVGDFVIKDPQKLMKIKFSAMQIDCTHIKGGLSLDSVLICPKGYTTNQV